MSRMMQSTAGLAHNPNRIVAHRVLAGLAGMVAGHHQFPVVRVETVGPVFKPAVEFMVLVSDLMFPFPGQE